MSIMLKAEDLVSVKITTTTGAEYIIPEVNPGMANAFQEAVRRVESTESVCLHTLCGGLLIIPTKCVQSVETIKKVDNDRSS